MCENVLQGIGQLERIYITETELDMRIDDEFGQTKNLSTQMECISEARLLTLLRCQSPACTYERKTHYCITNNLLDGLQVHIVVEV